MVEIGVECAAVLVRLSELMATSERSVVAHVVSDDPTTYVEIEPWVDQTKNELVDWRTGGKPVPVRSQKDNRLIQLPLGPDGSARY